LTKAFYLESDKLFVSRVDHPYTKKMGMANNQYIEMKIVAALVQELDICNQQLSKFDLCEIDETYYKLRKLTIIDALCNKLTQANNDLEDEE